MAQASGNVSSWDIVAIVVYFIAVLGVGFYSMFRSNRGTVSGYFLAGRFMTWLPVGASLYASNIGSEHFIGLAGSGAAAGFSVGSFELISGTCLLVLCWILLPVYIASGAHTLPEYMKKRFGGERIRIYLAVLSLMLYILAKLSVNMYAGALFIRLFFGWNIYFGILLILTMTGICSVTGGLAAVIYMDTLQCFLMIFGASVVTIFSFVEIGGYEALMEKYWAAVPNETLLLNNTCNLPHKDSFRLLRGATDPYMPWPGFILCIAMMGTWYWAADQMMVQRALAAKSISHAQGASIATGYFKLLPFFTMVLPGMISRILYTDEIACATPSACKAACDNEAGCSNIAFPKLILTMMPPGLKGIMFAVMLAALMSGLSSIFNSSSTLFTIDIYHRIRKKSSAREMLIVGRVFIVVMIILSILWVPVVSSHQGGQLFIYLVSVQSYLTPPIASIYLMAVLWKRCNEAGAFYGLVCGLLLGVVRLTMDFVYPEPPCGNPDHRPLMLKSINYMYFGVALGAFSALITFVVSLLTKPTEDFRLIRTTYWSRKEKKMRPDDEHEMAVVRNEEDERRRKLQKSSVESVQRQRSFRRTLQRRLYAGYSWFCGYDNSVNSEEHVREFEEHLHQLTTLEQTTFQKRILIINSLILLVMIAVSFSFFTFYTPVLAENYKPEWLKRLQQ